MKPKTLLLVFAGAGVLASLFFARPAYRKVKAYRAQSIARKAVALFENKQGEEAFYQARAALQLHPDNLEALRIFAKTYSVADQNRAYLYWGRVVAHPDATPADRGEYLEFLLRMGDLAKAREVLVALLQSGVPDPKACRLAADYFLLAGDAGEASRWIERALRTNPQDPQLKLGMARALSLSSKPEDRVQALQLLQEVTHGTGSEAVQAAELLIRNTPPGSPSFLHAARLLSSHPHATLREKLIVPEMEIRTKPESREKIVRDTLQRHPSAGDRDREEIGRWLNRVGEHARVVEILGKDPVSPSLSPALLLIRLDALAVLGRWAEIQAILSKEDLPLDPVLTEIFRARAAKETRQERQAEFHWSRVFALAGYDPARLIFAGEYALKIGALEQATRFFQLLAKFPSYAVSASRNLIAIAERQGDMGQLIKVIEDLSRQFPDDPGPKNDLAYLQLLLGRQTAESLAAAKNLVDSHPRLPALRITLALAHLRQKSPAEALRACESAEIEWEKAYPGWQAVYAASLAANGKKAEAQKIRSMIQAARLKKEEQELIRGW